MIEFERAVIEVPNHQPLDHHPHDPRHQRAAEDRQRQRHACPRHRRGDVGAAHDELAVGKVDDPHHPEDDGQPGARDDEERERVAELVEDSERRREKIHSSFPVSGCRSRRAKASARRAGGAYSAGGGFEGVYCALGSFSVRSQPASPSQ